MLLVSVLVKYDEWGRTGNRMFQFAFGKILSTEKSVPFYHDEMPNFDIKSNLPANFNNFITTRALGINKTNKNYLLETDKNILVDSFLQKACYYIDYKELLKKSFNIEYDKLLEEKLKDSLVIHYRETDYKDLKLLPNIKMYENFLSQNYFKDVIIVTDNSTCEGIKQLKSLGCILASEGVVDQFKTFCDDRGMYDFRIMLNSSNLLMSQSSFSWWAAFLGLDKKIFFPYYNKGMWPTEPKDDDIDLYFDFGTSTKLIYNDV